MKKLTEADRALFNWFLDQPIPQKPFELKPGQRVINPTQWTLATQCEVMGCLKGQLTAKARLGTLQADLRVLQEKANA